MNILITGVAGFIGSTLANELLKNKKNKVIGIDNLDNYYSKKLKLMRIKNLKKKNFKFHKLDLNAKNSLNKIIKIKIDVVYHFAAQAGVRYTLNDPLKYIENNLIAFYYIIEFIKNKKIKKLFYASSSSVYGDHKTYPLNENTFLKEKNIYSLTKRLNEMISYIYSKIFNLQIIGLRFFTVFGEWGRPDMLIFKYLKKNIENKKFYLNANGKHYRDFTYIDDVVKILIKLNKVKFKYKHEIFNICSNKPQKIISVINKINKIKKNFKYFPSKSKNLKKIEVNKTHGNNKKILLIIKKFKFTNFDIALENTILWYQKNKINQIT